MRSTFEVFDEYNHFTPKVGPVQALQAGCRHPGNSQVPDTIGAGANKSALVYGLWSELIVATGARSTSGGVSPSASKGGALLHDFPDCDIAVRHPEAFVHAGI